jgi:type II secretory pathway predicted ATPase ExeA
LKSRQEEQAGRAGRQEGIQSREAGKQAGKAEQTGWKPGKSDQAIRQALEACKHAGHERKSVTA